MKNKIVLFLFLLTSFVVNAQYPSPIFVKPNNSYGARQNRSEIDSVLYFVTGCGTPTDSTYLFSQQNNGKAEKPHMFAIYGDSCGHNVYFWDPQLKSWFSAGGGSFDTTTIYQNLNAKVANSGGANFWGSGLYASIPTPSIGPGFYYAIDSSEFFYSNGSIWAPISGIGQVQSDWTQTNTMSPAYIRNKPSIVQPADTVNKWVNRIYRSNDSVYYCKGSTCTFAFLDSLGAGSPFDSATTQNANVGGGFHTTGYNDTRYRAILDTAYAHLLATRAALKKSFDSISLVIGRDTVNLSFRSDTLGRARNIYARRTGGRGDSLLTASDSTLKTPGQVDSLDHHHIINANGDWTTYVQAHDTTSANAMVPKYDLDTMRIRLGAGGGGGTVDTNSHHLTAVVTQNQSDHRFTITKFGAIRDSTIDNTAAIQKAIDSCFANGGGTVIVPAGTWSVSKLNLGGRPTVSLEGEQMGTVLKSLTADTMINMFNNNFQGLTASLRGNASIKNISLKGHGLGTVGIAMYYIYWFKYENIIIDSFTNVGLLGKGALTGLFDNLTIEHCNVNAQMDSINLVGGEVAPNLIEFRGCRFYYGSTWGFFTNFSQGELRFNSCDFEFNGTAHNLNTGAIKMMGFNGTLTPLTIENCDFEQNKGIVIYNTNNFGASNIYINAVTIGVNPAASFGIYSNTSNSGNGQNFNIKNSVITGDSLDFFFTGFTTLLQENTTITTDNLTTSSRQFFVKNLSYNGTTDHLKSTAQGQSLTLKNGAGTGATFSFSADATEMGGSFSITTGTSPLANDTLCILGSQQKWGISGTSCISGPANNFAASLAGDAQIFSDFGGTNNYTYFFTNSIALQPSTTYRWHYIITGR